MTDINRWIPNRFGIFGYWLYDYVEYEFFNGNILFVGTNGSGKSMTTAALATLCLDGDFTSGNLVTNAKTNRSSSHAAIRDILYVGATDKDEERIAYVFTEFKRQHSNRYCTIGVGLRLYKYSSPVEFLGFVIPERTSVRLAIQEEMLSFCQRKGDSFVPYALSTFAKKISEPQVSADYANKPDAYANLVNKHLFGFPTMTEFNDAMRAVKALRSPKLNDQKQGKKNIDAENIDAVLRDCRPAPNATNTASIENTWQSFDDYQASIIQLRDAERALKVFSKHYLRYHIAKLRDREYKFNGASSSRNHAERKLLESRNSIANSNQLKNEAIEQLKVLEEEDSSLEAESAAIRSESKAQGLIERKQKLENERLEATNRAEIAKSNMIKAKANINTTSGEIFKAEKTRDQNKDILDDDINHSSEVAKEFGFAGHQTFIDSIVEPENRTSAFKAWQDVAATKSQNIQAVVTAAQKLVHIDQRLDSLRKEREQISDRYRRCEANVRTFANDLEVCHLSYSAAIAKWLDDAKKLAPNLIVDSNNVNTAFNEVDFALNRNTEIIEFTRKVEDIRSRSLELCRHAKDYHSSNKSELNGKLQNILTEKFEAEAVLNKLFESKQQEPERTEQVKKTREFLRYADIPHVPFFEAVDFKDFVSDSEKAIIEALLVATGVIDCLVIPAKEQLRLPQDVFDSVLVPPRETLSGVQCLADYLSPCIPVNSGISIDDVQAILASVAIEEFWFGVGHKNVAISLSTRTYALGNIIGRIDEPNKPNFIGAENRRRYLAERIAEQELIVKKIADKEAHYVHIIRETDERLNMAKVSEGNYPDDEANILNQGYIKLFQEREKRDKEKTEQITKDNEITKTNNDKVIAVEALKIAAEVAVLPYNSQSSTVFLQISENALEKSREYSASINNVTTSLARYSESENNVKMLQERCQSQEELRDQAQETYDHWYERIIDLEGQITGIDYALNDPEEKKRAQRIRDIEVRRKNISNNILEYTETKASAQTDLDTQNKILPDFEKDCILQNAVYKAMQSLVETQRKYCTDLLPENLRLEEAKKLQMEGHYDYRTHVEEALSSLRSYNHQFITDTDPYPWDINLIDDNVQQRKRDIDDMARKDASYFRHNKTMSVEETLKYVRTAVEEKVRLIAEKEAELFRDTICKDLCNDLVGRIRETQNWVQEVRKLMASNPCRNVRFDLIWAPNPDMISGGVSVDEMTQKAEIIDSLSEDAKTPVYAFFRDRLEWAKREREIKKEETFSALVAEALDYRNWYKFQIKWQRAGEGDQWKDLNATSSISGGEGVMSMSPPLFAALAACYGKARIDAPRIVALDEAFVGVDQGNSDSLFEMLNTLEINYIINSCADLFLRSSVKNLAIYHLMSSIEKKTVAFLSYTWNGFEYQPNNLTERSIDDSLESESS